MPSITGYAQALSDRTSSVDVTPNGAGSRFDRGTSSADPIAAFASSSDIARSGSFVCGQRKTASPGMSDGISSSTGIRSLVRILS